MKAGADNSEFERFTRVRSTKKHLYVDLYNEKLGVNNTQ